MSADEPQSVSLTLAEAGELAERALTRIGYGGEAAPIIAAHLIGSELTGYPALGLARILTIAEHRLHGEPRRPLAITHQTPVSARIDCGNMVGLYAIEAVADIAIAKAKAQGFALVGAHNAYLSGRNAHYLEKIARAGFAAIHSACSQPVVAPLGGAAPAFGTNPIGFALPHDPDPVILDIATGAANVGDLILAGRLGKRLAPGIAVDASGHPTDDPAAALAGAILPFAGHRGAGLSFMIQALGLLGGAGLTRGNPQDFGFLFVVFDPGLLMPPELLAGHVGELIARVKATPRQPGVEAIRLPSEHAFAERRRRLALERPIDLPRAIRDRIAAL